MTSGSTAVRAAIAGTGFVGGVHAHAVRAAGGTVAGVLASTPERSAAAAGRLNAERAYASTDELLDDPSIDVVHICTPNHLHEQLALDALAAGKHVICEKPLAVDVDGAERLVEAAAGHDRLATTVPFVYRFYPTVREARRRIADGESGAVHLIHGHYLQDWLLTPEDDNWRVDPGLGGASRTFADIGSHWCDLAEFVTGHRITRLTARTQTAIRERAHDVHRAAFETSNGSGHTRTVTTEDAALMQFETDHGAFGSMLVSQISAGRKNRLWLEVDAAGEALQFDQENPETLWIGGRAANTVVHRDVATLGAGPARLVTTPGGHPQGYQDCFNLFVADAYTAARTGEAPDGLPRFADGLRAARITDAVLESARSESWIDVVPSEVHA